MTRQTMTQGIERDLAEEFRGLDTRFLLAMIHGDVDPVSVARRELADRGIGPSGRWMGLAEAYRALGVDDAG
jgi:hypothetical protein